MYVLDADIVNQVFHNNPVVLRRVEEHLNDVWISAVTIEEVMQGALGAINTARATKRDVRSSYHLLVNVFDILKNFHVLRYTDEAHRIYGSFTRAQLNRGKNDCRLAAIALAHQCTVVTRNTRHFDGLVDVENWMD